jgi:hypothetical protein
MAAIRQNLSSLPGDLDKADFQEADIPNALPGWIAVLHRTPVNPLNRQSMRLTVARVPSLSRLLNYTFR